MKPRDSLAKVRGASGGAVDVIRGFNRLYTRQLGLLDHGLLGSEFTLAEARILYELANRDEPTATQIARELAIDLGYMSRITKKFERRRLIKRVRSPVDARQSLLLLTEKGHAAFDPLDRAARRQIAAMIEPMSPAQRSELLAAMRSVQSLLQPGEPQKTGPYTIRSLRIGDIGWITHRQALLYSHEYGWDGTYEALVAEILAGFIKNFDSNSESGWVAERNDVIVGSVFLVRASPGLAKLRLLYVEPAARGLGIGTRLVHECIEFARANGYRTLTLWTNDVLASARRIYEAAGFELTREEAHRSFGKDLLGQTWELAL
ncbi:MAG TPA: helix-turn-helix domain-containing GNAT family N-acetyltransferase [Steroidobacteraceae bacterium]|jgi:DNA-binding MarR family transcriptional regulator/GNAT superfamily N-acetyltransferase|nr:helix-turn-helix domain-containing GNAT family N-acetyltransferase [Steroidobacteraceae bacterium]